MTSSVRPGHVVAGRYRIDGILGSGAMGVVYAAMHVDLDERVALKLMLPQLARIDELVTRFLHEARAAAKLRSPHVTRVFDVGRLEDGAPYLVMELLDGCSLADCLEQRERLGLREAASIVIQACHGLEDAHACGIVHRDLKPANIFLARQRDGSIAVKVLDFGIAKMIGVNRDLAETQTGMLMGSPLYMSPEQMRSAKDVDARADVWGLGVILYKLLTGTTPYDSEAFGELILDVHTTAPRPITELLPDIPDALADAVASCLARDRDARCSSVRELAERLAPFAQGASRLDDTLQSPPSSVVATQPAPSASDTVVIDTLREAAAAWPTFSVAPAAFKRAMLGAIEGGASLDRIHAEDLYLALGCLAGEQAARTAFEREVIAVVVPSLRRARARNASLEQVTSALRARLFGADGHEAKLAEYMGRATLVAWVRAAALRILLESGVEGRHLPYVSPGDEVEVAAAAKEAIGTLPLEFRTVLRFHVGDGLSIERLAQMIGTPASIILCRVDEGMQRAVDAGSRILRQRGAFSAHNLDRFRSVLRRELSRRAV
jgi:serine/threonine-protein kinase